MIADTDPSRARRVEIAGEMEGRAGETAYYINGKLPRIALIGKGVRFPDGQWVRLTGDLVPPSLVQDLAADLFPGLRDAIVPVATLLTDFDVDEFERELESNHAP